MKLFTEADVDTAGMFPHIYADTQDLVDAEPDWMKRGLQQTATGYGARLNSGRKINFNGKLYRVYITQYSNAGSAWFISKGRKIFVS